MKTTSRRKLLPVSLVLLASGCTSLSGLDGETSYSCPLPQRGNCKPMTQVYAESVQAESGVQPAAAPAPASAAPTTPVAASGTPFTLPGLPATLLSRPRVLRVYITPWADSKDTLLEGRRAYLKLDAGSWRLEHFRANERKAYAPSAILPPSAAVEAPAKSAAAEAQASPAPSPSAFPPNPFLAESIAAGAQPVKGGAR